MFRVASSQALNYRLAVNNLTRRLPAGSYVEAAYVGLQDTAPRDALLAMHARVADCEPSAWKDPQLIQTYSPRQAVYVLPKDDFGVFTVGRLPRDLETRQSLEDLAEKVCLALKGQEQRAVALPGLRTACATGRIALRWTTSALYVREHPRPSIDPEVARLELCRRHIHVFGPTRPTTFAWWAGVSARDARTSFNTLASDLIPIDFAGHRAWVLAADEDAVRSAKPMRGVRLLVAPDLRMFGQDRTRLFVGPGRYQHSALQDSFHPNGLMVDGRILGAWGRRGGQVNIEAAGPLPAGTIRAIRDEAETMPIPETKVTVSLTEH